MVIQAENAAIVVVVVVDVVVAVVAVAIVISCAPFLSLKGFQCHTAAVWLFLDSCRLWLLLIPSPSHSPLLSLHSSGFWLLGPLH